MTTDNVKQPPEGVDLMVVYVGLDGEERVTHGFFQRGFWWVGFQQQKLTPSPDSRAYSVVEWFRMPTRDRLAILDRYDEERAEWTRQVDELDLRRSLLEEKLENLENDRGDDFNDLAAQVTALTEERDQQTEDRDRLIREKGVMVAELLTRGTLLDEALARADRAEKERDEALEWRRRVADALDCIKDNGTIGDAEYVSGHAFKVRKFAEERDKMRKAVRDG